MILKLYNMHQTFLKIIAFVSNLHVSKNSYNVVQNSICLDSLSLRKQVADIIFFYDLLNGNFDRPVLS